MRWAPRSLLVFVAAMVVAAAAGCGDDESVASDASDMSTTTGDAPPVLEDDAPELSEDEVASACADAPPDTQCGLTFEELRDLNVATKQHTQAIARMLDRLG